MPTSYYIVTTDIVKKLIQDNDILGLEQYLQNLEKDRVYHVLSHAVDVANTKVLNHFANLITTQYIPNGNAYNLLHLATENYVSDHKNLDKLETIKIILENGKNNDGNNFNSGIAMRCLIPFLNDNITDLVVLDLFVSYDISIWDLYHYSIAWNYPKVFDMILEKYSGKIDFNWLSHACNIATSFNHMEMAEYATIRTKAKQYGIKCHIDNIDYALKAYNKIKKI